LLARALDRGDAIGCAHRLAVMPLEAVAQREGVGQFVVADFPLLDHLWVRLKILVDRKQGVEDEIAEIAGDVSGGPDRIDAPKVGLREEAQRRRC
jgi:hypothetical protein